MPDLHKTMAQLSPIISRLGMIESAISQAGGPTFKITRNPEGIIEMLDYASTSGDATVKERYQELMRCEHKVSLAALAEIGHTAITNSNNSSQGSRFYRGSKVAPITTSDTQANNATTAVDGQHALDVSAQPEIKEKVKTKTIKIVYRGKVSYKEVPI